MESVRSAGSEQKRGQKTDQGGRAGIIRAADHNRQFGAFKGRYGSIAREGSSHICGAKEEWKLCECDKAGVKLSE